MKKICFLWIIEMVLGICSAIFLMRIYNIINIISLYLLLFAPSLITAILFIFMIKIKAIKKLDGKYLYFISGIFALIGTAVFVMMNLIVQSQVNILPAIIENTRQILNEQYLVVKEGSNIVDYIMIFAFIFIVFWIIGRERKNNINERNKY